MDAIRVARGEVDPDPVLESTEISARMIDVTPAPKVLDLPPTDADLDAIELEEELATELPY